MTGLRAEWQYQGPWLCPECRAGKHRNCTREAWDDHQDEPTTCQCEGCPE